MFRSDFLDPPQEGSPHCWYEVVDAYIRFHDNLRVYNSIAGGLGKPYFKRCSIPQGCPFSMMFIALLLRPLIFLTKAPGRLIIRILADNILLLGLGPDHLSVSMQQFCVVTQLLGDMGARVSTTKCFLFSSLTLYRDYLRRYVWPHVNGTIQVASDFRDEVRILLPLLNIRRPP